MSGRPRVLDLPHEKRTVIDEADWPLVSGFALYVGNHGYASFSRWYDGASHPQTLHGFLMKPPKGTHVDHINGDKLDNRRANLRVVSPSQNQANRHRLNKNNTSGVRGVTRRGSRWIAQIMVDRRALYLGTFATPEEAVLVRREAELQYFGAPCPSA